VGITVRPHPDRGNSGPKRRFVRRAGTNRAYNANMGGIVADSSFPHACYGRRRGDLTSVIFLACPVGKVLEHG
jgi:hypothetical protein